MAKKLKARPAEKCPVCGRRVARTYNWDPITQAYVHTRCWFKARAKEPK